MVVLIVSREFAVSALRYVALTEGIVIAAGDLGKTKMMAQVLAVSLLLMAPYSPLIDGLAYIALWLVVLVTIWSMVDYFRNFWKRSDAPLKPESEGLPAMEKNLRRSERQ